MKDPIQKAYSRDFSHFMTLRFEGLRQKAAFSS